MVGSNDINGDWTSLSLNFSLSSLAELPVSIVFVVLICKFDSADVAATGAAVVMILDADSDLFGTPLTTGTVVTLFVALELSVCCEVRSTAGLGTDT